MRKIFLACCFVLISFSANSKELCNINQVNSYDWSSDISGYPESNIADYVLEWKKDYISNTKHAFFLAKAHHIGNEIPTNIEEAEKYYKFAISKGHAPSMHNLAVLWLTNPVLKKTGKEVFDLACQAALKGFNLSKTLIGLLYVEGRIVPKNESLAIPWLMSAKNNDINALIGLGSIYRNKNSEFYDQEKIQYVEKLIEDIDNPESHSVIGSQYFFGINGYEKDEKKAEKWLLLSAKKGHKVAQSNLGLLYESMGRYDKSFEWYLKSAEQNYLAGLSGVSNAYYNGNGVLINFEKSIEYSEKILSLKNTNTFDEPYFRIAHFQLALMYSRKDFKLFDLDKALENYRAAVLYNPTETDKPHIDFFVQILISKGLYNEAKKFIHLSSKEQEFASVLKNPKEPYSQYLIASYKIQFSDESAIGNLEYAAENGNANAQGTLSEIYGGKVTHFDIEEDERLYLFWLKKAASNNHPLSQNNLGTHYFNGDLVDKDLNQAISLYKKAIAGGEKLALANLAKIYIEFEEYRDYKQARQLLEKAAQSDSQAMMTISTYYTYGKGPYEIDLTKGHEWALKAANKLWHEAMYVVGLNYLNGKGVEKNKELALSWIGKSIDNDPNYSPNFGEPDWFVSSAKDLLGIMIIQDSNHDQNAAWEYASVRDFYREYDAENGDDKEKFEVAKEYIFEEKNIEKGLKWMEIAAENEYGPAQTALGRIYEGSYTTLVEKQDYKKAKYWLEKAIKNNDYDAYSVIGWVHLFDDENGGDINELYDVKKALQYFEEGRKHKLYRSITGLAHIYRYNHLKEQKINVEKILELYKEAIEVSTRQIDTDSLYVSAFEVQINNNNIIDENLLNKGFSVLFDYANKGDSEYISKLSKIYLNENSPFHNQKEAFYWLEIASNDSIEANLILANLYFTPQYYNFHKHGKYLKKAVNLYESGKAQDYSFYRFYYPVGILYGYQLLSNYYIASDARELAEIYIRKASSLHSNNQDNAFEIKRQILLSSIAGDSSNLKELYKRMLSTPNQNQEEMLQYIYLSVIGTHANLRKEKKYRESIKTIQKFLESFQDNQLVLFTPILTLEMARDYISLGEMDAAERLLEKYQTLMESLKPNFFEKIAGQLISGIDYDDVEEYAEKNKNPIEDILFNILNAIIQINNNESDIAVKQILTNLKKIQKLGVPIRAVDIDFAITPVNILVKQSKFDDAKILMKEVINLYKQHAERRVSEGYNITSNERRYISNAISNYLNIADLSGDSLEDLGFEDMQLVSGLTLSKTFLDALKMKKFSGTEFAMRKIYSDLKTKRNNLISRKLSDISNQQILQETNDELNLIDKEILEYELKLKDTNSKVLQSFISSREDVQRIISEDEAILSTLSSDNYIYTWLVTKNSIKRHRISYSKERITKLVKSLKESLDPTNTSNISFDYDASKKLYEILIKPYDKELGVIDRLIFVPDSAFSTLPITLLNSDFDYSKDNLMPLEEKPSMRGLSESVTINKSVNTKTKWLIEKFAISTMPSIHSIVIAAENAPSKNFADMKFLGIGNPRLSGENNVFLRGKVGNKEIRGDISDSLSSLAPLPETEEELRVISKIFRNSDLYLGEDATEINIRNKDLSGYDVISFATHALVSNEIQNLYEPALVLTPVDSSSSANDGLLTASEVIELNINADIVLLSACNTASAISNISEEGLTGLTNSFFNAGAKSLLVSYWSVISDSAVELNTKIFSSSNTGITYAHKLRNAILSLLNNEDPLKRSPKYWAPFSVIGIN